MIPDPGNASDSVSASRAEALKTALKSAEKFWPLTPKQVYYLMVGRGQAGRGFIDYAEFVALLDTVRHQGLLPVRSVWEAPPDVRLGGAWDNTEDFIRAEIQDLLWGYRRNLCQGQPRYVEVWLEKHELADFFANVTLDYCVSTVVCPPVPGFGFFEDLRRRLADLPPGRAGVPGQKPEVVVLYFGDYEPTVREDLPQLRQALRDQADIWDVTLKRVALTRNLVVEKSLPSIMRLSSADEVIHPGTPHLGDDPVELEALDPKLLSSLLHQSIESELDMALFENQKELQKRELASLARLRADILLRLKDIIPK